MKVILILLGCFTAATVAKVYQPCQLAKELVWKYGFPRSQIYDWVCLVENESRFNTQALNPYNSDGSKDHGLFQVENDPLNSISHSTVAL